METKENNQAGDIVILDDLIAKSFEKIAANSEKLDKIGDLLKMIELRRKLSPTDHEQKKFWKMIDRIRQEKMSQPKKKPAQQSGNKK